MPPLTSSTCSPLDHDLLYLDEIFGVALLPLGQTKPIPVTKHEISLSVASNSHKTLWFDVLPTEIRIIVLELVYNDNRQEAQFNEDRITSLLAKPHTLRKGGTHDLDRPEMAMKIRTQPSFKSLFVSKAFLAEALPIYAKHNYVQITSMHLMGPVSRTQTVNSFQQTFIDICELSTHLVIRQKNWFQNMIDGTHRLLICFPRLSSICMVGFSDLVWCEDGDIERVFKKDDASIHSPLDSRRRLQQNEIDEILHSSGLPTILRSAHVKTWWKWAQPNNYRYWYYVHMERLLQKLRERDWQGQVIYQCELKCAKELPDPNTNVMLPRDARLKMKIDLFHDRLVEARLEYYQEDAPIFSGVLIGQSANRPATAQAVF